MLEYARWKYLTVAFVLLLALVFAAPNFFGEDVALQVARRDRAAIDDKARGSVEEFLKSKGVTFKRSYVEQGNRLMVLFDDVQTQLKARDAVNEGLSDTYVSALSSASRAPAFLRAVGLRPMPLGLDLRGGLYLLYSVDVGSAVQQLLNSYEQDFRRALSAQNLKFTDVAIISTDATTVPNALRVTFPQDVDLAAARSAMQKVASDLTYRVDDGARAVEASMSAAQIRARQDNSIQQNIVTLRNRVNELGVSEPQVVRQGADRIAVQLPGVQNAAEVKDILGKTASLEFRLTDTVNSVAEAVARGRAPIGSKIYYHRDKRPTLLKREVIATGEQLVDATATVGQEGPEVSVRLNSAGAERMLEATRKNVGKPMGVVLVEKTRETTTVNGQKVDRDVTKEEVINEATIRSAFGNQFRITGLGQVESRELALLMRSGQLAASMTPIQERAITASLGQESIDKGVMALVIGMVALFAFMILYYHVFGMVASAVLLANVVLLTALLSMFHTTLTLPGIAGMLLTVGMAVDANVIIYERIREELRNKVTPQAAIRAGFDKAFSAILDSNVTTFIAGLVLWVFGTGAIRGFAVVLTVGIATSMFTSVMGSRALLTLMYGGKHRPAKLSIG
jgi:preprotein translocase subunit SecD